MCKERRRTRDLLLEYDAAIMPPRPRTAGLSMVYPWEDLALATFKQQLYQVLGDNGLNWSEEKLDEILEAIKNNRQILYAHYNNFPARGETEMLYFDLDDKVLYYWENNKYTPINTLLIAETILQGGGA